MVPLYDKDGIQLYVNDCVKFSQSIEGATIDLTLTSPPYDDLRSYTGEGQWNWKSFTDLVEQLYRITKDGGVVVWNVCDQTVDGSETGNSFRQALYFIEAGFKLADTMIYKKANPGGARGSNKTYLQCFEYMFVFSKGKLVTHNLIADRPNKRPGAQTGGGRRNKDGSQGLTKSYASAEFGRRFNLWEYPTQQDEFSANHPAPFPLQLAVDHILSWSNEGDVVFDPFMGSGTTAKAARLNKRRCISVDVSAEYATIAAARVKDCPTESPFIKFD